MSRIRELENVFWEACAKILPAVIDKPEKFIRWRHPTNGAPDWTVSDNVLFLNLMERDEAYAKQRHNVFLTGATGEVTKRSMRTRTWDLYCTAYGPDSCEIVNLLKDGFFLLEIKKILADSSIYLVPYLPSCMQMSEVFAGKWWERWDLTLTFNEEHFTSEDVGAVQKISFGFSANAK